MRTNWKLVLWFGAIGLGCIGASNAQPSIVDISFNPGTGAQNGIVESIVVQPDKKILLCGNFTSFAGPSHGYMVRLLPNGAVDETFNAYPGYWVRFMALQPDQKIVIGGWFIDVEGEPRNCIARLNSDGSLDRSFNPGTGCEGKIVPADPNDPFVFAVAVQDDGKIVIGGNFITYNGEPRSGLARLNSDGSLDSTFHVGQGVNSWVRSLMLLPGGQMLVSGWFTTYDNQGHNRMMRLTSDGSADPGFNPYFGDSTAIYSMALQPDGQIVVGGHSINAEAAFHKEVARLFPDGSYDPTFNPNGTGADDKVESVLLQPDGKILIGGYFALYNDLASDSIARLNPDGTLDPTFHARLDNWVWTVAYQDPVRVLICGAFSTVDGYSRSGIARLMLTPIPVLAAPRLEGTTFSVSVSSEAGKTYSLEYKDSVTDPGWVSLPPVIGDGAILNLTDPNAPLSARVYRVRQN